MNTTARLKKLYQKIKQNGQNNAQIYFYIAQIKESDRNYESYKNPLYIDVKLFIESYILSRANQDYGYDIIDVNKIEIIICYITEPEKRYALFSKAYRDLYFHKFEEEAELLVSHIRKQKILVILNSINKFRIFKVFLHVVSYNIYTAILFSIVFYLISYILFLPSFYENFSIIELDYNLYHKNFYVNHFFNLIDYYFGITDKCNLKPIDWRGVVLLSCVKLLFLVFVVNYFFKIILDRLQLIK